MVVWEAAVFVGQFHCCRPKVKLFLSQRVLLLRLSFGSVVQKRLCFSSS